ncbi:unnamed protein product [Linum trigynum]|uniref:Proteasome assembly chaperone 3 n=1 Tax=Linum trigynum TaxID=586398 RepID=A0AAV2G4Y0_9ROSI
MEIQTNSNVFKFPHPNDPLVISVTKCGIYPVLASQILHLLNSKGTAQLSLFSGRNICGEEDSQLLYVDLLTGSCREFFHVLRYNLYMVLNNIKSAAKNRWDNVGP